MALPEKGTREAVTGSALIEPVCRRERLSHLRNLSSWILFVGACAVWLAGICRLGVSHEGLPWYLTLGTFASLSVRFLRFKEDCPVSFTHTLQCREPLLLKESVAICFLSVAVALYLWIGYGLLHPPAEPARITQIVDIQLVSQKDFRDNNDVLPGTEPREDLRERNADQITQAGNICQPQVLKASPDKKNRPANTDSENRKPQPRTPETCKSKPPEKAASSNTAPAMPENQAPPPYTVPLNIPTHWQTTTVTHVTPVAPAYREASTSPGNPSRPKDAQEPYLMEVAPPELVELLENEGEKNALHVFQPGGKSSGGTGAENDLSRYLKELHKRIKTAWSPPRGTTRKVEVLFRIKKDGRLAFLKIERSSGQSETDASATKAITSATNGLSLPKDYSPQYLDVRYTFKYNVDELQEISKVNSAN